MWLRYPCTRSLGLSINLQVVRYPGVSQVSDGCAWAPCNHSVAVYSGMTEEMLKRVVCGHGDVSRAVSFLGLVKFRLGGRFQQPWLAFARHYCGRKCTIQFIFQCQVLAEVQDAQNHAKCSGLHPARFWRIANCDVLRSSHIVSAMIFPWIDNFPPHWWYTI